MQSTMGQFWVGPLGWIADRPRGAALVATVLLALIAAFIRPPVIEGSMVDQLSGTNEQLEIAGRVSAATGNTSTTAIIVAPRNASIAAVFADLANLRQRLADLDDRIIVSSIDAASDQLFLYRLLRNDPVSELLGVLAEDPRSTTIISRDSTRFLIIITSPETLRQSVLDVLDGRAWKTLYTEHVVLASALLERDVAAGLAKDLRLLMPAIVSATLIALFVAFGCWRALLLPLFASAASMVVTFALFSATFVTINLITLLALPVVLIVGLANSCHFLAKAAAGVASRNSADAAVRLTLQRVGPPFFFSTLTTSVALASLSFNELPPIASLGLLSAAALLIVFLLVLLAAPLSLRWYLRGVGRSWQGARPFAAFSAWLAVWRPHISAILLLVMIGGAITVPLLTVKSEPRAFFPDAAPFSSALRLFEDEFYIFSPLRVLVSAHNDDRLIALQSSAALRLALAEHPGIRKVTMQPAVHGQNAYVLSALLAKEDELSSIRALLDNAGLGENADVIYTHASLVYGDIDRQAMVSLLRSLGWSVGLIFGAVLVVFRSLRAMLSAMLTNAVPLMFVCGAVWLIGSPLNLVTVFVFLVALGVIVDDSIHILCWRAAGDSVSGSSIEFSVLLSTVMLCLGLLLCQLSDFPTTRQFAAYCALALVGAVVSNLSVLPLLLGSSSSRSALS